jgi:hypothetical protein
MMTSWSSNALEAATTSPSAPSRLPISLYAGTTNDH